MKKMELELGGKKLIIEVGHLAKQANGAALVRYGDTVLLTTVVMAKEPKKDIDFFPLSVEYKERTYAAGKIPGGFFKREGRPTTKEILTCRLVDRPLRPLFPKGFKHDVQIVPMVLSVDGVNPPDILSIIGASAALTFSDIPFYGPVGAVRVGRVNDQFILNPGYEDMAKSSLNIVIAGKKDAVLMIEAEANEVAEEVIIDAINFAKPFITNIIKFQEEFAREVGKAKREVIISSISEDIKTKVDNFAREKMKKALDTSDKNLMKENLSNLEKEAMEHFKSGFSEDEKGELIINNILEEMEKGIVRNKILNESKRTDGRSLTDIRQITCEVGVLPRTHGSGLFTRGQTQSLSVVTLGTTQDEQRMDDLEGESTESFMLHYNFPPFSVGEVGRFSGPGRREIGHGALAQKALKSILPTSDKFPYTIRLVSEILESNGSSSMATVCAGTLSLMDAGVPIKSPVAGIAMGLIKEGNKVAILSDILGQEDHLGDMDFKVAGTRNGITALQMDIKIDGLDESIMKTALSQAKAGRLFILGKMEEVISKPRADISNYAPRIIIIQIDQAKIKDVIGPGGKIIRGIIEQTGVEIDIKDSGQVYISSVSVESAKMAQDMVEYLTRDVNIGEIYTGKVTRVVNFGAFVEILPGKEGLVHVSQLADHHVKNVEDIVKEGDEILVKVIEIDNQGRINLSRKAALTPEKLRDEKK
ncbi:MAG: polyribonucleotide nucleotidyltransferase [bacterium]|nr:polyribonucleotide nucleotidyltransferase [bacterium]